MSYQRPHVVNEPLDEFFIPVRLALHDKLTLFADSSRGNFDFEFMLLFRFGIGLGQDVSALSYQV